MHEFLGLGLVGLIAAGALFWFALRAFGLKSVDERLQTGGRRIFGGHGVVVHMEIDPSNMQTTGVYRPTSFWFPSGHAVSAPRDIAVPWWNWAHGQDGLDVETSVIQVTIQSTVPRAVAVDRPILRSRNLGRPAGLIRSPQGLGGGDVQPRLYVFDLDDPTAQPRCSDMSSDSRCSSFSISANDTERLVIAVSTKSNLHSWSITLPLIVDGKRIELVLDNGGRDFRTIGEEGYETIYWLMSGNGWSK